MMSYVSRILTLDIGGIRTDSDPIRQNPLKTNEMQNNHFELTEQTAPGPAPPPRPPGGGGGG